MSHRTNGLYRILEWPSMYERLQELLGSRAAQARFVNEFVRPFPGAAVLDIGCGTGSLLDYLPEGVHYVGFDLNAVYIEEAVRRRGNRGRFFCARAGEVRLDEETFDIVIAKAILHHLDDVDVHRLMENAQRWMRPAGVFVSLDCTIHDGQSVLSRLIIRCDRGAQPRSPDGYRCLAESHFTAIDAWLKTDMLSIPYSHYIMRASSRAPARSGNSQTAVQASGAS